MSDDGQADAVAEIPDEFTPQWEEIRAEVTYRNIGTAATKLRLVGNDEDVLTTVARNVALELGDETGHSTAVYIEVDLILLAASLTGGSSIDHVAGRYQSRDEKLSVVSALTASRDGPTVLVFRHIGAVPPKVRSVIDPVLETHGPHIRHTGQKISGDPDELVVICVQTTSDSALSFRFKCRAGGTWDFSQTRGNKT